jgi:Uma2 family endonuclease
LWLVDEAFRQIEVRVLKDNSYKRGVALEKEELLRSVVLPGFEIKVGSVFGD